jgi:hypothetical protein
MSTPDFLASLPPDELERLASVYADLAFASGLAVTREDGSTLAIPPVLTPTIVSNQELDRRVALASRLAAAIAKVARAVLDSPRREVLLEGMVPLEREVVSKTFRDIGKIPNVRVDFFNGPGGAVRALEVNATIPAMQGYSDIAASAFIRAVGNARGFSDQKVMELTARNGSNARALLRALVDCYRSRGGTRAPPTIAQCARHNDAPLTELTYLSRAFTSLGFPALVTNPDELSVSGDEINVGGRRVDLLYRHIFARRVQEGSVLWRILQEPARFMVFNPIDPQLEVKATLAELSAAGCDPALAREYGLTEADLETARNAVPWTRRLVPGASTGPAGEAIPDLLSYVSAVPSRFVIKRSWEYGGKAVFLGAALSEEPSRKRMEECFGEILSWSSLVTRASADLRGGGFVVQELVPSEKRSLLVCDAAGKPRREDMYVDYSGYASIGVAAPSWGGVCRASGSAIVNIVGGGGVGPLLREGVANMLLG